MNIRLPDLVIAALYKDSLVITKEKNTTAAPQWQVSNKTAIQEEEPSPENKKWFLGDNKKNILLLIKDGSAVFINDEWLGTLTKLLTACRLNLGDVAIINYSQHHVSFNELQQLQPRHVFMFDVSTQEIRLPFIIPHYQIQQYAGSTFMTAPAITLSTEQTTLIKTEKKKLWEKLKTIFSV